MHLLASITVLLLPLTSAIPNPRPLPLPYLPGGGGDGPPVPWPACQTNLSCDFFTIEGAPLSERLAYVRTMQSKFFGPRLNSPTQWRNIEGVIQFFMDKSLGAEGTWVSYTDAGIVEAVQRGGAIALGLSSDDGGNPGAQPWADFMKGMKAGTLGDRVTHDHAWSVAEQAGTDYGGNMAEGIGIEPDAHTSRWYLFTQFYRLLMRNENIINDLAVVSEAFNSLPVGVTVSLFIDWFFDVTNPKPTYCGGNAAWDLASLDGINFDPSNLYNDFNILSALLPKFIDCYKQYNG